MATKSLHLSPEVLKTLCLCARSSKEPVYLVGGALRDALLGRTLHDLDLAVQKPRALAQALCQKLKGTLVVLDEQNAIFRVVPKIGCKEIKQIDISQIQGANIHKDLERRDFTINAMALLLTTKMPTNAPTKNILDPYHGLSDLQNQILRAKSQKLFQDDPVRLLRAFRIAAQLDFNIEPQTLKMIGKTRSLVLKPAAERIKTELLTLLSIPGASKWFKVMDQIKLLTAIFPAMEASRRCALVYYGPGGVLTHSLDTMARMDFLLANLKRAFTKEAENIEAELVRRSQGEASFVAVLRLTAFLHDVSKPETAKKMDGRLRFFRHDEIGAAKVSAILRHLRFAREPIAAASAIVANHLRPGNLAANHTVTDRAAYRFFRDIGEHSLGLLLTCWSDHASYMPEDRLKKLLPLTRKKLGSLTSMVKESEQKTLYHLQVISLLMRRLFDQDNKPIPERLINGKDVMTLMNIPASPEVGVWLERVREAQAEGKIRTRQEALAYLTRKKS